MTRSLVLVDQTLADSVVNSWHGLFVGFYGAIFGPCGDQFYYPLDVGTHFTALGLVPAASFIGLAGAFTCLG